MSINFDFNMSDSEQDELLERLFIELNSAIFDNQASRLDFINFLKTIDNKL